MIEWTMHLIDLQNMIAAGCSFGPDDLAPEEWQGLIALRSAQSAIKLDRAESRREGRER